MMDTITLIASLKDSHYLRTLKRRVVRWHIMSLEKAHPEDIDHEAIEALRAKLRKQEAEVGIPINSISRSRNQ